MPRFAITDEQCPVLTLVKTLHDRGWVGENRLINHTNATTLVMDGTVSTRMRWYYVLFVFYVGSFFAAF